MAFSTPIFLFYFLPVVLAIYYALPWLGHAADLSEEAVSRTRNGWLLLTQPGAGPRQRAWVVLGAVGLSLGTLGFFKYFNSPHSNTLPCEPTAHAPSEPSVPPRSP